VHFARFFFARQTALIRSGFDSFASLHKGAKITARSGRKNALPRHKHPRDGARRRGRIFSFLTSNYAKCAQKSRGEFAPPPAPGRAAKFMRNKIPAPARFTTRHDHKKFRCNINAETPVNRPKPPSCG